MRVSVITWDWKRQMPTDCLNDCLKEFEKPYVQDVETESDHYAIVVTEGEVSQEDAQEMYWAYLNQLVIEDGGCEGDG